MRSAGRVVSAFLMAASLVLGAVAIILFGTAAHAGDSVCLRILLSRSTPAVVDPLDNGTRTISGSRVDSITRPRQSLWRLNVADANENHYHSTLKRRSSADSALTAPASARL